MVYYEVAMKKKRALANSRWWFVEENNMKYKLQKTDGRFTGHGVYSYFVDFSMDFPAIMASNTYSGFTRRLSERSRLNDIRNWCWTTFGPGCELETALMLNRTKEHPAWCWLTEHNKLRIYFTEETANWFTLKWMHNDHPN